MFALPLIPTLPQTAEAIPFDRVFGGHFKLMDKYPVLLTTKYALKLTLSLAGGPKSIFADKGPEEKPILGSPLFGGLT